MKNEITDKLGLTRDITQNAAIITLSGQDEAYIENHKGIIEFTDKLLKIRTKHYKILILGENLNISFFSIDEMKINGKFLEIKYY